MSANNGCLLGLYDELMTFMSQVNIYRQKGLVNSHELATILSLYNGGRWSRRTGIIWFLMSVYVDFHNKSQPLSFVSLSVRDQLYP